MTNNILLITTVMALSTTPPYQAFTLYFVLTFVLKNTCRNPSCHLFEQNMGNSLRLWMKHHGRMRGITFQWNRGAGGVKTLKHAKQHGKHGLNFSFSRSVFYDNFGEANGLNNHTILPNPYWLDGALGKDRDYGTKPCKLLRENPKPTSTNPPRQPKPGVNEPRKWND